MNDAGGKRVVGVLGGMGPDATVDFMSKVVRMTPARSDQDHLRMIVDHNPQVPDRQAAIHGDPAPVREALTAMAQKLQAAGAEFLVMPCNTAHAFYEQARDAVTIPFINIVDETVAAIDATSPDAHAVGLLATDACLIAGVYQVSIERTGRRVEVPDGASQAKLMDLIFRIKAGDRGAEVKSGMTGLANELVDRGAEILIAGCTEIPLVIDGDDLPVPLISSTYVLAERTLALADRGTPLPQE